MTTHDATAAHDAQAKACAQLQYEYATAEIQLAQLAAEDLAAFDTVLNGRRTSQGETRAEHQTRIQEAADALLAKFPAENENIERIRREIAAANAELARLAAARDAAAEQDLR